MKISWVYSLRDNGFYISLDKTTYYAHKLFIDGNEQEHECGEREIITWAMTEEYVPHAVIEFKAVSKCEKPALGVMPCYIAAEKRISDLTDAIKRQIKAEKPNYDLIKRWADEIGNQCDLIEHDRSWDE